MDALADDGYRQERDMRATSIGFTPEGYERWSIRRGVSPPVDAIFDLMTDTVVRMERVGGDTWPRS